jgi:hypothetical protein
VPSGPPSKQGSAQRSAEISGPHSGRGSVSDMPDRGMGFRNFSDD